VTNDDTTTEQIATVELARLRRVEEAAKELLDQMQGRRSATTVLSAVAALRAALKEAPPEAT
jgi:cysteine sulfinate desulfinase/cysteine desulfurase-like protein